MFLHTKLSLLATVLKLDRYFIAFTYVASRGILAAGGFAF